MAVSKAQQRAVTKYTKTNYEDLRIRVAKGRKADIQAHCDEMDESINGFVNRAIAETMARDQAKKAAEEDSSV